MPPFSQGPTLYNPYTAECFPQRTGMSLFRALHFKLLRNLLAQLTKKLACLGVRGAARRPCQLSCGISLESSDLSSRATAPFRWGMVSKKASFQESPSVTLSRIWNTASHAEVPLVTTTESLNTYGIGTPFPIILWAPPLRCLCRASATGDDPKMWLPQLQTRSQESSATAFCSVADCF